jgi:hypothetical protein
MPAMGVIRWLTANWFDLVQSLGIIASLIFSGVIFRHDLRTRRVANLIELTKQHRAIWTEMDRHPELARVLNENVDLARTPVMPEEERFIHALILHLNSAYHAMKEGLFIKPDGLEKDVRRFFSRPIAKAVWQKEKSIQDTEFVRFVERCLSSQEPTTQT